MSTPPLWDLFCKVIDNFGDVGVSWRLAADLASRGQHVRLWCDDPSALHWLAPQGAPGVEVITWREPLPQWAPGQVVIEAFACDPPAVFVQAMAQAPEPPVWINLEYLSAETWVERCHGLPSPQAAGPGAGLMKWFFHPGFTRATGGLIREAGLEQAQAQFDRDGWLRSQGLALRAHERLVTLFCYDNPALPELLGLLGDQPTLLVLTPGPAQAQVHRWALPANLRTHDLPWLSQTDFDRLLWSADLNLVRGEDSLVRALWAGRPFLWQLYPQQDGAHQVKSQAFLDLLLGEAGRSAHAAPWATDLQRLWQRWNAGPGTAAERPAWGAAAGTSCSTAHTAPSGGHDSQIQPLAWPSWTAWTGAVQALRDHLRAQDDLTTQLMRFVAAHPSKRQR